MNVRHDGEPALCAFLDSALQTWDAEVVPQQTAPGDWKAHGPVENGVKLMKGFVRTAVDALETRLGEKLAPDHPLLTWVVRFVSTMHYRYAMEGGW